MKNRGIYRTVGSGTVTQANMKLSGVDGGSTASGGAFVDFGAANVLTTKVGHLLKITDSAGKSIIGYTKSAMAGESLDTEIATGTLTALKLYKITATEVNHFGTGKVVGSYFTSAGTETCDANNKVQQVLVGAATGVTIVSAQDGTQYNWFNKNSAFNWNDASGYTYQIIQENGKVVSTNNTYTSNFSAGENGWTATQGAVAGNQDSIGGENDWLKFTVNTYNGEHNARYAYSFVAGRKYRLTFKYYVPSSQTAVAGIIPTIGGYASDLGTSYLKTQDAVTTVNYEFIAAHTNINIYPVTSGNSTTVNDAGGDDVFYIKDVVVTELNAATTVTSGTLHLDASNTAMFFHDSIDFSSYAGTDAGSTPYLIAFYDSSGYMASAYGGAVGAGESLDVEKIENTTGEDTSWWNVNASDTVGSVSGGETGNCLQLTAGTGSPYMYHSGVGGVYGKLYKTSFYCKNGTATGKLVSLYLSNSTNGLSATTTSSWASKSGYITNPTQNATLYYQGYSVGIGNTTLIDTLSFKNVLDVPITGLHLFTTKNGTTRGMATKSSSFNPNTITKVKIYRAY